MVSVSLKGINGATYEEARRFFIKTINEEARRLSVLSDSTEFDETDHELLTQLKKKEMTNDSLVYSIRELTELLEKHYGRKVIVLIDEYDVPLAKANENGYYDAMVLLIRNLFENALKTNSSLKFAVLTGCLRIAKESIFTGLNNFNCKAVTRETLLVRFLPCRSYVSVTEGQSVRLRTVVSRVRISAEVLMEYWQSGRLG